MKTQKVSKVNKKKLKNLGGRGKSFDFRNCLIVSLRDDAKLSYGVIGEITGKNKKTVREIYDRDHNKLKGKIKILISAD